MKSVKRLAILVSAAIFTAVPFASPAQAATGEFRYKILGLGPGGGYWSKISNPRDQVCYSLTQQSAYVVRNLTNRKARVYSTKDCTGWNPVIVPAGGGADSPIGNHFRSVQILDI
ncbi:hypothetical protein ACFU76_16360 [Streptomyces sp. NPDC057539]|uniref:hypothetical protein n=1 Tax=Streptomyces sp. NPDC057539 TaxID=3346159 RepID=UPI0036ACB584